MATFDIDEKRINLFEISDTFLSSHYFDNRDIFKKLSDWYVKERDRFEVPRDKHDEVEEIFREYYFDPVLDDPARFCVVINQNSEYKDILRNWVHHRNQGAADTSSQKDQLEVKKPSKTEPMNPAPATSKPHGETVSCMN